MMKKFMILVVSVMIFMACDYATESLELKPDIEITWLDPVAWYIYPYDTTYSAQIAEIHFVAENSIDSYLSEFFIEYYTNADSLVFTTAPVPVYGKIEGIVQAGCCDTFILYNIVVPLAPAYQYLGPNESMQTLLHFVAVDEYFENTDTAEVWFGIWMLP
ncbi:MAG: hypothetical protein JSV53_04930 [candidate division WOR-3 bacterium]|nr:MAG: hypothetical protein JSV53_04930 [candidate division WOR-3 bacterium]